MEKIKDVLNEQAQTQNEEAQVKNEQAQVQTTNETKTAKEKLLAYFNSKSIEVNDSPILPQNEFAVAMDYIGKKLNTNEFQFIGSTKDKYEYNYFSYKEQIVRLSKTNTKFIINNPNKEFFFVVKESLDASIPNYAVCSFENKSQKSNLSIEKFKLDMQKLELERQMFEHSKNSNS